MKQSNFEFQPSPDEVHKGIAETLRRIAAGAEPLRVPLPPENGGPMPRRKRTEDAPHRAGSERFPAQKKTAMGEFDRIQREKEAEEGY